MNQKFDLEWDLMKLKICFIKIQNKKINEVKK